MRLSKMKVRAILLVLTLVCAIPPHALPITHVEIKMACPICKTENSVTAIMSWGSYIYQSPSRFQLVFFPQTDSSQLYHCKRCHFTAGPDDFENFPAEKRADVTKMLERVWHPTHIEDYREIPMSERLGIAEQYYQLFDLGEDFWCRFYRLKGYFLQQEGKKEEAATARAKALEIARKLVAREDRVGERKELLVIVAAMHHYLGDDTSAVAALEAANAITYSNPKRKPDENQNVDTYLSGLIRDYQRAIREGLNTDKEWKSGGAQEEEKKEPDDEG